MSAPKIVLLGSGLKWKDEIIKITNNTWTETPVAFYYVDTENYDDDILSWLYLNMKNSDFIIGRLATTDDISLITPFIELEITFIINEIDSIFATWYNYLNPNSHLSSLPSIVSKIKSVWTESKFTKYNKG
ncbi:MAG: hypothetical protein HC836_23345 [Richelia sp. RM2_1_2]|nr:hypothetical protein [Richelia sp. RM2_1_2]